MIKLIILLSSMLCLSGCAVATVGAVMYFKSASHEVATVNINAPADNVYRVALETANQNESVKISLQDDQNRVLELIQNDANVSFKVSPLSDRRSQLLVASDVSQMNKQQQVLDGVFKVCSLLGVTCKLSE